jgi:hypothetical protein
MNDIDRLPAQDAARVDARTLYIGAALLATFLVFAVRLAFVSRIEFCGGADACFYVALAKEIAARHDFFVDFIWNYQVGHVQLPSMAMEYWRPGTSLLLDLALPFGGVTLRSSAVIATIATVLAALAAADFAWTMTRDRAIALLGYLIALVLPTFWTLALSADSAPFYGAAVAWFLALFTARSDSRRRDVLAILCVGAAYLIRNDAIILAVPFAAVLAMRMSEQAARGTWRRELPYTIALAAGFVAALLPTHLLIYLTTGRLTNASIMAVLFFNDVANFWYYGSRADAATWLAKGIRPLIELRLRVLAEIVHHLLVRFSEPVTLMALIAVAFGASRRGRASFAGSLLGPLAFLGSIVAFYALAMPTIGDHATARSYTGFLPILAALAAVGIARVAISRRAFIALAVGVVSFSALDGINGARTLLNDYQQILTEYRAEAQIITAASGPAATAVAMVQNPAPFTTTTGIRSIPLPTNGLEATRQAVKDFGVTAIIVDKWSAPSGLARDLNALSTQEVPDTSEIVITLPPAVAR